jgi:hypothetical protein
MLLQRIWDGGRSPGIAIDFFLSFVLLSMILVAGAVGLILAVQNRNDIGLVLLAVLACIFLAREYFTEWSFDTAVFPLFWPFITAFAGHRFLRLDSE